MLVFVEYAAEPVSSADVEPVESGWFGERLGDRPEGRATQGSMVPVLVVEGLELAERLQQVRLVPDQGGARSSCLQVCTQRSMIEFIRGTRMPVVTIPMPSDSKTGVRRQGLEPRTRRLRVCCSGIRSVLSVSVYVGSSATPPVPLSGGAAT